jgi:hypothetical protein
MAPAVTMVPTISTAPRMIFMAPPPRPPPLPLVTGMMWNTASSPMACQGFVASRCSVSATCFVGLARMQRYQPSMSVF